MSEERLAYDNHILQRELDRRGDPSLDPCERIGHELDLAQTRIAELERREKLLTAMSITAMEYRQRVPHDMGSVEQRMEACERALTDAGFPWSDATPEQEEDDAFIACELCGAPVLIDGLTLCGPCNTGDES